jgi:glycosyltransferase involved in cell wall biosynthesis
MKILMLTQLFQPEPNHLKGLAFAKELNTRGHDVQVLTGFPNYPEGKFYKGYKVRPVFKEKIEGVTVIRIPHYPSHDRSGFKRIVSYISFAVCASIWGIFHIKKPDIVHVYQGPGTLAIPAVIMAWLRRTPFVLDIQDMWPESVMSSGMLRMPFASSILHALSNWTCVHARRIIVLSKGYKRVLIGRGIPGSKIDVVYNWCPEDQPQAPSTPFDEIFRQDKKLKIIYAGNFGAFQGLDTAIRAARMLQENATPAAFFLIGSGVQYDKLKQLANKLNTLNVKFIPRQTVSVINRLMQQADALLIHLKNDPLTRIGIPQKTQAYLFAGRPILVGVNGDCAELVKTAGAGIAFEPENPASLADAVKKLSLMSKTERNKIAACGKQFYHNKLAFTVGVTRIEQTFHSAINSDFPPGIEQPS